jgi:hypothetical protein
MSGWSIHPPAPPRRSAENSAWLTKQPGGTRRTRRRERPAGPIESRTMINWPNKTQRRVLRELAEVTIADGGYFHERLDMPVEEVRRHLQALADLGMVEEAR